MSNVLLVTCGADAAASCLRHAAGDAIGIIDRLDGRCALRERHLYARAIPVLDEKIVAALLTSPKERSAEQWRCAACTDVLLQEVRAADIVVIAAPVDEGHLPKEVLAWSEHVGFAASCIARSEKLPSQRNKIAIVIAAADCDAGAPDEHEMLCSNLRERLGPAGVSDVAFLEARADGYPLRPAPLMLVIAQSRAVH